MLCSASPCEEFGGGVEHPWFHFVVVAASQVPCPWTFPFQDCWGPSIEAFEHTVVVVVAAAVVETVLLAGSHWQ